MNRSIAVAHDD